MICCLTAAFLCSPFQLPVDGDCGYYDGTYKKATSAITVPADMLAAVVPSNPDSPGSCGRYFKEVLICDIETTSRLHALALLRNCDATSSNIHMWSDFSDTITVRSPTLKDLRYDALYRWHYNNRDHGVQVL